MTGRLTGERAAQVWATDTVRQFCRTFFSTAWTAWREVYAQDAIIGTVSQTAGVPTGAVIERGSNANGEFERFADGLQICTRSITLSSGAATTWTFPAAFIAAPAVSGSMIATVSSSLQQDSAPTATTASLSAWSSANARRADTGTVQATGRWF